MEILQVIMHKNANRRHLLLDFFEKELQEKEWQEKYIFQKPRNKTYQQKNLVGLKNPHSICYVNSFLQQLYHIPEFKN
jgi:ubiquitin C-terminal hydrolase